MPKAELALIPVARVTAATPSGLELPERHRSIRKAFTTAPTSFGARALVFEPTFVLNAFCLFKSSGFGNFWPRPCLGTIVVRSLSIFRFPRSRRDCRATTGRREVHPYRRSEE